MFPSRKWVAEGAQVLFKPLLPKLHPLLEPLGGQGLGNRRTCRHLSPGSGETEPWRAILQQLNSRCSLQSTQHGKGHTEGLGPWGQGYASSPCLPPMSGMH